MNIGFLTGIKKEKGKDPSSEKKQPTEDVSFKPPVLQQTILAIIL